MPRHKYRVAPVPMGHRDCTPPNSTMAAPSRPGFRPAQGRTKRARPMDLQPESMDRPVAASLKATYRALLARGLEAGEAANLTAFLHGLPSAGFRWTLPGGRGDRPPPTDATQRNNAPPPARVGPPRQPGHGSGDRPPGAPPLGPAPRTSSIRLPPDRIPRTFPASEDLLPSARESRDGARLLGAPSLLARPGPRHRRRCRLRLACARPASVRSAIQFDTIRGPWRPAQHPIVSGRSSAS